ncbi:hypothetical protein DXG01_015403 [Tephrocybe rancida]|nr:hypothetical protein DXG01_015403 [Tephrocybe rancida]
MANVVFDDTQLNSLSLGGGTWSEVTIERFFDGSAIWPAFATTDNGDTGKYGSFSMSFDGTSISFFGNTPSLNASQNIFVSIDGSKPYETFYNDPSPPTALQWYQSPVLSEGTHTINVSHIAGTSIDYAVVTAGRDTPLTGQTLIVDDGDPSIVYEGSWTRNTGRYTSSDNPHSGFPYGNATSQSNTVGSKATFLFSGMCLFRTSRNNVTVFSVFDWSHLGYVEVTYTLDSVARTIRHEVTRASADFLNGALQRENTLLYASDSSLNTGNHNLTMEVTANMNQTSFVLDYILYTPSFGTLASKPNLIPSQSSTLSLSSATSNAAPSSTSGSVGSGGTKSTPTGAIVGGVVGGVAVIAILFILFLFRKRFLSCMESSEPESQLPGEADHSIEPFINTAPSLAATHGANSSSWNDSARDGSIRGQTISDSASGVIGPAMVQHKPVLSISTYSPNPPPIWPVRPELDQQKTGSSSGPGGGLLTSRIQRLQDLVTELNREIAESGEGSVRVAILRGRIAELTREDADAAAAAVRGTGTAMTAVPPPYEPRRDEAD